MRECPDCGAEIVWLRCIDGRRRPFDREPILPPGDVTAWCWRQGVGMEPVGAWGTVSGLRRHYCTEGRTRWLDEQTHQRSAAVIVSETVRHLR